MHGGVGQCGCGADCDVPSAQNEQNSRDNKHLSAHARVHSGGQGRGVHMAVLWNTYAAALQKADKVY